MNLLYLDFIRYSIGAAEYDDSHFRNMDWQGLFNFGMKQSLLGVLFVGIQRMDSTECIDPQLLLKFITAAKKIKRLNKSINVDAVELDRPLEHSGFLHCILKGQGVATMYPEPLMRQPGDIDMWVMAKDDAMNANIRHLSLEKSRRKIIGLVKDRFLNVDIWYHHVDYPVFENVKVELHFTPTWMGCYWHNRELQRWMAENWGSQSENRVMLPEAGEVAVPTKDFNVIYLLIHIFRHVLSEGVGICQLMDYYYLLMNLDIRSGEYTELLHRFGLVKIAGAVMWVLGDVFMLPRERMIAVPNEKRGRRLLNVVINGGNFGLYDKGIDRSQGRSMRYFLDKFVYRGRLLADYPNEVAWSYLFSSWQKLWKLWKGY